MSESVRIPASRNCDVCIMEGATVEAAYDGKTIFGPWANMCARHFREVGVGLGTGKGQRLVLERPKPLTLTKQAMDEPVEI